MGCVRGFRLSVGSCIRETFSWRENKFHVIAENNNLFLRGIHHADWAVTS